MRLFLTFSALLLAVACVRNETVAAYGGADHVWQLSSIDGMPVSYVATLSFATDGQVAGTGPCNEFAARQSAPYPWFALERFVATEIYCDKLTDEQSFFATLQEMSLSEVSGTRLILSNDAKREMLFTAVTGG
ncbi:META domain-containing protein [Shimia sp. W99]